MEDFNFNWMDGDDFEKKFMEFLNAHQSGLENFMKEKFVPKNPFNNHPTDGDILREVFKNLNGMNINLGGDVNGVWKEKTWVSPNGRSLINSYTWNPSNNPLENRFKFNQSNEETDTLKLLEKKLNVAVTEEDYESAAKVRDLIKLLKEDIKKTTL